MIYIIGDTHGNFEVFHNLVQYIEAEDTVISVGDFGFYDRPLLYWKPTPFRVLAIDGNHEDFNLLATFQAGVAVRENLYYVPRGTVMTIEGIKFGFMGGGASIDKAYRVPGQNWFPEEVITDEQVDRFIAENPEGVDVLITHTPGSRTIAGCFPPLHFPDWGIPAGWVDTSAVNIQRLLDTMPHKKHYCGHMHRAVIDGRTRILDIDEVLEVNASIV